MAPIVKRLAPVLALSVAFSGCSQVQTGGTGGRSNSFTQPHVLRIGDISDVVSLNPMLASQVEASLLGELNMAYLIRFDHNNEPLPELATAVPSLKNGGISADGKTYTFHLRKGVVWSDGAPFSAADVAFSTKVVLDPNTNVTSRDGWNLITKMETPDPYTIVYHLSKPYSPFAASTFATGGGFGILPKHLLEHTADINKDPYNSKPVGIGPFMVKEWARGDHITLVRNPKYWRGQAKLDKIVFQIIPSRDTLFNELQTGEVDLWSLVSRHYYPQVSALPAFTTVKQPSFSYNHYDLNLTHPVLKEKIVRQALRLAVNRKLFIDKIYHGIGIVRDGFESPASPYFDPTIKTAPFDPAKANAMLDADGWKRGPDGVRSKNGLRLALTYVSNLGSPDTDTMIENLRSMWKAIGVDFTRKDYNPALLFAQYKDGGILNTGKFDVLGYGTYQAASADQSSGFGCNDAPPNGQNTPHWCDAKAEAAIQEILVSSDPAVQKRDVDIVQERVADDVPTIVQNVNEDIYAENRDLKNFKPNQVSPYDDFMQVDI